MMKKIIYLITFSLAFTFCKGPGSGPLVRESFNKKDQTQSQPAAGQAHQGRVVTEKVNVKVEPCPDCITIAKLYEAKQNYSGKVIKVKGQVIKFNSGIMGKNWIHLQDGSEYDGNYDLTITTDATVTVGQTVTFEGKIALDKDFGYGYSYSVLMEDGKSVQ
jgi:hypothetical protein